ncbi:MAG TPA: DUF4304 domain-containing protein [Tepidisphaeraceae bacterium]|jgi:hypothetical protein
MHDSKKQLSTALSPLLREHGFRRRALTWHKTCTDTILVFHVEKNRWGANRYTFHLGVYIRALGSELTPPHYRCPVQIDLDSLVPDPERLQQASNFEDPSANTADRLSTIVELVASYALPWLEQHSTLRALNALAQGDYDALLPRVRVFRSAHDYLRGLELNT